MVVLRKPPFSLLRWSQTFRGSGFNSLPKNIFFLFRGCIYFNWDPCIFWGTFQSSGHFGGISRPKMKPKASHRILVINFGPWLVVFLWHLLHPLTGKMRTIISHSYEPNGIVECHWWVQKAVAHLDCLQLIPREKWCFLVIEQYLYCHDYCVTP